MKIKNFKCEDCGTEQWLIKASVCKKCGGKMVENPERTIDDLKKKREEAKEAAFMEEFELGFAELTDWLATK